MVFQPVISLCGCPVGKSGGKENLVFLISLEGMYRSAGDIGDPLSFQKGINLLLLADKGRDDADLAVRVCLDIGNDLPGFFRSNILNLRLAGGDIDIGQGIAVGIVGVDFQLVIVVLAVTEIDYLAVAAIMVGKQDLLRDGIAGQIGFIDGILYIIILRSDAVFCLERVVVPGRKKDHR